MKRRNRTSRHSRINRPFYKHQRLHSNLPPKSHPPLHLDLNAKIKCKGRVYTSEVGIISITVYLNEQSRLSPHTMSYKTRKEVLPRSEIEALIADGHHIVIYNGKVLKLDNWLDRHPGGDMAIFHVVGRDATDEINAYHSDEALATMGAYQIGITGEKSGKTFCHLSREECFENGAVLLQMRAFRCPAAHPAHHRRQ